MVSCIRFCLAMGLILAACGVGFADPIEITVTAYDPTFTVPGAFTTYGSGLATSLFVNQTAAGNPLPVGVEWSVNSNSNIPGDPVEGTLATNTIDVNNILGTPVFFEVAVKGIGYTGPGVPFGPVTATSTSSTSDIDVATVGIRTLFDAFTIDSDLFTATLDASSGAIGVIRGATYALTAIYQVSLGPDGPSLSPSVNVISNLRVIPFQGGPIVPEPWNAVSVVATLLPVGLLYMALRRRKPDAGE